MGEIRKRERNGRISYLARHYGPEGRKVSKSFDRRKDATDWLTTVETPSSPAPMWIRTAPKSP
jgi:hypothetical protein